MDVVPEPTSEHLQVLRKYFGHSNFRPLQWKIIYSVIKEKRDNIVLMATGYGKSLCYQYPAVYCQSLSIVISPLISLMQDQVLSLQMSNISACFLGSSQTKKIESLTDVFSGVCRVLYITPEYGTSEDGLSFLSKLHVTRSITLLAVDEAHCVSQWGHDFRHAYRNLDKVRTILTDVPVLALTATATPQVKMDICISLKLRKPKVTQTSFNRPNLYFSVSLKSGASKSDHIYKLFKNMMEKNYRGRKFPPGPTIIYCLTKNKTEEIAGVLNDHGIRCGIYHAGLCLTRRTQVHEDFLRDKLGVVVATIAFGMGIDKPNVRCVIHYGAPKDIESYYQEIGRAGRDGLPSICHVFYSPEDITLNRFITKTERKISEKFQKHKELMARKMQTFLETQKCRRRLLLSYFGETATEGEEDMQTPKSNCCDNCDLGLKKGCGLEPPTDVCITAEMKLLLQAFSLFDGRFGITVPIKFLRGSQEAKIPKDKLNHELYGAGKSTSEAAWKALARLCLREDLLKEKAIQSSFRGHHTVRRFPMSTVTITNEGLDFIRKGNKSHVLFEIPKEVEILFKKRKLPLVINENRISCWESNLQKYKNDKSLTKEKEQLAFLFKELKTLRDNLVCSHNCAPHMIFSNATLFQMAVNPPCDKNQLANVKDVTEAKIEKFGDAFINKILEFFGKKDSSSTVADGEKLFDQNDDFLSMMSAEYLNENAVDYTKLDNNSKEYVLTEEELALFQDEILLPVTDTTDNDDLWGDEQDDFFDKLPLEELEELASSKQDESVKFTPSDSGQITSQNDGKRFIPELANSQVYYKFEDIEGKSSDSCSSLFAVENTSIPTEHEWKTMENECNISPTKSVLTDQEKQINKNQTNFASFSSCHPCLASTSENKMKNEERNISNISDRTSKFLKSNIVYENEESDNEKHKLTSSAFKSKTDSEPKLCFKKRTLPNWLTQADAKRTIEKKMKSNSLFKI